MKALPSKYQRIFDTAQREEAQHQQATRPRQEAVTIGPAPLPGTPESLAWWKAWYQGQGQAQEQARIRLTTYQRQADEA